METDGGNNQRSLLALLAIVYIVVLSAPTTTTLFYPETSRHDSASRLQLTYSVPYYRMGIPGDVSTSSMTSITRSLTT